MRICQYYFNKNIHPAQNELILKLKYDKIIIETDADIDGFHIRVINLEFFLKFYPELIQQGHVYIGEPPLYRLANQNGKGYYYVATQNEFIDKCIETIGDVNLKFPYRNDEIISAAKFVSNAFDYLTKLREISADRNVNSQFLEHIAFGFVKYGPTVDKVTDFIPGNLDDAIADPISKTAT